MALVSVVVLCRDNPLELAATLATVTVQAAALHHLDHQLEILVVDGSSPANPFDTATLDTATVVTTVQPSPGVVLRRLWEPPAGIYAAMNVGLAASRGSWVQFMNAGDGFLTPASLAALLEHGERLRAADPEQGPAAVFGQAVIEGRGTDGPGSAAPGGAGAGGAGPRWCTPPSRVRSLRRWLRHMVPCHQAMLFRGDWARRHPYDTSSGICADRPVMRLALAATGERAWLRQPVCRYRLGGRSSRLPDWAELRLRWAEPGRTPPERWADLVKFLLRPVEGLYPQLMRLRAFWLGRVC